MKIAKDEMQLVATTIRTLAMDGVQKAKSGHPGMPMGCAEIAAVLWLKALKHSPSDPAWPNRDRFVLSAGHGSMLLYSMLHLSGYDLSIDDLKSFRQWGSRTPGHPEFGHTPGVETTTGPLGQGVANAVGMALAQELLRAEFNGVNPVIDHFIYALAGDGDLMEGVAYEAASLAGHWGLGRLIVIYDSNEITIEGSTNLAFSEDVAARFTACGWHVQTADGHDCDEIEAALAAARRDTARPSLVIAKTRIAKGSPGREGSEESHGAPLGEDEVKKAKANLGCDPDGTFCVNERVYEIFARRRGEIEVEYDTWKSMFGKTVTGALKKRWEIFFSAVDADALRGALPVFEAGKNIATRSAGGKVLEALFGELPNLAGGSADLAPSNKSFVKGFGETGRGAIGRNIHFGIREHAMGAIQNGIAYYGGFIPYSATFFVFMDYMRPPVRLAALAGLRSIYIFTHDSFFVGEDGPTHQPVEQLAAARAIPRLSVIRPADAEETREAWLAALSGDSRPTAILLTRQDIPVLERGTGGALGLHRGAYVLWDPKRALDILFLASGSEVHIALEAAKELESAGIGARVVSFPSWDLFEKQPESYRRGVLPASVSRRVVVEAGISMGWERYAGDGALYVTLEHFGASAPAGVLAGRFGFTKDTIVARVRSYLGR
ncbi:MAG TPA: transketolase [Spirochaetota bacterium]|nr:transketolase [Spirochaetota bacterium]